MELLPEGEPFYSGDEITDLNTRFFVAEMIREKIYDLYEEEIPYHTTVLVTEFKEKTGFDKNFSGYYCAAGNAKRNFTGRKRKQ